MTSRPFEGSGGAERRRNALPGAGRWLMIVMGLPLGLLLGCGPGSTTPEWLHVSAGSGFACGIRADNSMQCWGADPEEWEPGRPPTPEGEFRVAAVSYYVACGLDLAGYVQCNTRLGSVGSPPDTEFAEIALGRFAGFGLTMEGEIVTWGEPVSGEGDAPTTGGWTAISSGGDYNGELGNNHTCAIAAEGRIECWGADNLGQASPPEGVFDRISVDGEHSCATLVEDGSIQCWGKDDYGQSSPPSGSFADVEVGPWYSCGIRAEDGLAECWGRNDHHDPSTPGPVEPPDGAFQQISASLGYACGITTEGDLACWGSNPTGQHIAPE